MNILIVNTAFDYADYIAVTDDKKYAFKTDSNARHSETSLVYIDKALGECGIGINDVDVIAVNLGPGSFTGIRIGVGLVKGFASANSKFKLIGFNSFEPLISRLNNDGNIYIETGKADYYFAKVRGGEICEMGSCQNIDESEPFVVFNDSEDASYKENELVNMVNKRIANAKFNELSQLEPVYLKLSQAEQELLSKEKNL